MIKAMASWNEQKQHREMANSKRQRRPNVRLGEIGDLPAALLTALYFSGKQDLDSSDEDVSQGDSAPNSEGPGTSDAAVSAAILGKTRALVYVGNGNFHGQNAQGHNMHAHSLSSQYALRLCSQSGIDEKPQLSSKRSFTKGSNGKRRRGASRGLPPIEKLTRAIPSVIEIDDNEKENTSPVDTPMNMLSRQHYSANTPEELETSEDFQGAKETSNLQETRALETSMMHSGSLELQQCNGPAIVPDKDGRENAGETREGSANNQANPICGTASELCESKCHRQTKLIPEVKHLPEANGNLEDREPHDTGKEQQLGRLLSHVSLANGVSGWLHNLGLGKYAPLFEVHEVDTEVLPLLTLEDLKEIGIQAVGTRRKLFFAIQQMGKAVMI